MTTSICIRRRSQPGVLFAQQLRRPVWAVECGSARAFPELNKEAAGAEASRLEHRLEATLRAETMAEVDAAEDFIWATGNLTRSLVTGGHGPYYGHRPRIRPRGAP